jgi:hypothetical protein
MSDTVIGDMIVRLTGDGSSYQNMLKDAEQATNLVSKNVGNAVKNIEDTVNKANISLAGLGGQLAIVGGLVAGVFGTMVHKAAQSAGKFEQTTIAFETMLGSAKETRKTLADLTKFAAETPFEMPEIEQAARGLITFGERGDELMKTLKLIGNAAAGTSTQFGMVALIFNQIRGVGHLLTQDFRQLSTRGILSLEDIAKHYKITTTAAQDMLSSGRITFQGVKDIFESMSKEGGRFANLMERQSTSFLGLVSTFKDSVNIMFRQIGEEFIPILKLGIATMIQFTAIFANMDPVTKKVIAGVMLLVTAIGTVMVALGGFLVTSSLLASSLATLATSLGFASSTALTGYVTTATLAIIPTIAWTAATWLLSAAMYALPFVIIAAGAIALGIGIYKLIEYFGGVTAVVWLFNKAVSITGTVWGWIKSAVSETYSLGKAAWDAALGYDKLNASLKEGQLYTNQVKVQHTKETTKLIETGSNLIGKDQRKQYFEDEMKVASKAVEDQNRQVKSAEEKIKGLNTYWAAAFGSNQLNVAKENLKEMEAGLANSKERAAALQKELDKLKPGELRDKALGEIDKMTEELENQIRVLEIGADAAQREKWALEGVSAAEMVLYDVTKKNQQFLEARKKATDDLVDQNKEMQKHIKFVQSGAKDLISYNAALAGVDAEVIALNKSLRDQTKQLERTAELTKSITELTNSLKEQVMLFGLTGEAAEIFKLKIKGATDSQLEEVQKWLKIKEAQEKDLKLTEEGKQITDKYKSPIEKAREEHEKLKELLDKNKIDLATYNKAIKDVDKELDKDHKLDFSVKGVDAVLAGSLEAFNMMQEYQAGLKVGNQQGGASIPGLAPDGSLPGGGTPAVQQLTGRGKKRWNLPKIGNLGRTPTGISDIFNAQPQQRQAGEPGDVSQPGSGADANETLASIKLGIDKLVILSGQQLGKDPFQVFEDNLV